MLHHREGVVQDLVYLASSQVNLSLAYPGNWDMDMYIHRGEDMHQLQGSTYVEAAR